MKKNLLLGIALAAFGFFLFSSSSGGRAASANQGNTGAPGDNSRTCINCHNTGSIQVDLNLEVLDMDGNVVTEYIPGELYKVRVVIEDVGTVSPSAHGFQMVCIDAPLDVDGSDVKNWIDNTSNNYKIASARGRQYVEHDGPSGSNEFLIDWQAPTTSSGQVSFYAAGNGVNLNGGTSGDGASIDKLELLEQSLTNSNDLQPIEISIFPNPVVQNLNINFTHAFTGQLKIVDVKGVAVWNGRLTDETTFSLNLENTNLTNGMYSVILIHDSGIQKENKFVVLR